MSSTHKAAICRAASAAAGRQMQEFVADGVLTSVQVDEVIGAHEHHVHSMTEIAAAIPEPDGD